MKWFGGNWWLGSAIYEDPWNGNDDPQAGGFFVESKSPQLTSSTQLRLAFLDGQNKLTNSKN